MRNRKIPVERTLCAIELNQNKPDSASSAQGHKRTDHFYDLFAPLSPLKDTALYKACPSFTNWVRF